MMKKELDVYIEFQGNAVPVGSISGTDYRDACFSYDLSYLEKGYRGISVSLPRKEGAFSAEETRSFFEGLLPEGFSRKSVSEWAKVAEEDYLSILEELGRECIGALMIVPKGEYSNRKEFYQKLTMEEVRALAAEGAVKSTELLMETHLSLAGASSKVGLYYDEEQREWYRPVGRLASTHIVKQSHVRFRKIVLNELFCMEVAQRLGICVPETFLVEVGSGEEVLFATKRYDREIRIEECEEHLHSPRRLHQEDFAQALGIPSVEKYELNDRGYLRKMFQLLRMVSSDPIEDQLQLWDRLVVNYLLGNTDGHIKNYSLLYSAELNAVRLAPAYDIISTTIYQTTKKMPFYIGGISDITALDREAFLRAAKEVGIGARLAMEHFDQLTGRFDAVVREVSAEFQEKGYEGVDELRCHLLKE